MKNYLIFLSCFIFLYSSCKKESNSNSEILDCENITTALLDFELENLKSMLNPEFENFTMLDLDNDACPYDLRLNAIVDFINENCNELNAAVQCCACVFTDPPLSEMTISFLSDGTSIIRTIDLVITEEDYLMITEVH